MNKLNQILLGVVFVFLIVWYVWLIKQIGPEAVDIQIVTKEDVQVNVKLRSKGLVKDKITFDIIDHPKHGTLNTHSNENIYTPDKDYHGPDRFSYQVVTDSSHSDPAEVFIKITPVNDPPIVDSISLVTAEDTSADIYLKGKDKEDDFLSFLITKQPTHGTLSGIAPNLVYFPDQDYFGEDNIGYQARDKDSFSEEATININIAPVNDPPKLTNQKLTVFENTMVKFNYQSYDPDSNTINYKIVRFPKFGEVKVNQGVVIYTPKRNFTGHDHFLYSASDEFSESAPAVIDLEIKKISRNSDLKEVLNNVVQHGGVAIGSYLKPEYIFHSGKYVPASILKIVTAAAALHYLGPKYRFKTEFYLDNNRNLYIKGFGDPCLSSKNWHEIARYLRSKNLFDQDFNRLVIDSSVFSDKLKVDGRRQTIHYYDAPPSSLASNQNTVAVRIKKDRRIKVIDEFTPLTKFVAKRAKRLPVGYQHFNIALNSKESIEYSAELVAEIFKEYGALFNDHDLKGKVPDGLLPVYTFYSEIDLHSVVKEMLRDSNNFIANQLLLVLTYEIKGEGFDIEMGARIVSSFLKSEIGIDPRNFNLVEGSGLSTKNNIDLVAMLKIVGYFKKYRELLPHLSSSKYADLAKVGRKWNIVAKSGTLSNIETLAGFIQVRKKEWKPFVIMLNNDEKMRGTVLDIIAKYYNG